jgi:ubiquinone/menaquinone biosynthesis C-methylase UbiE
MADPSVSETILLPHRLRKKAVQRLALRPGETVLEIGCGTGRNLPLLCDAVGNDGQVIGVDASSGMLARAQQWVTRHHRQNVRLLHQDAAELTLPGQVDAALFSLSYSVLPTARRCCRRRGRHCAPTDASSSWTPVCQTARSAGCLGPSARR